MLSKEEENSPKHMIRDSSIFHKGRAQLGNLVLRKMSITGGTDVDWLVERNGGFIILETKELSKNILTVSLGQMIALESLYNRLNSGGKCYFYFFGYDKDTDWTDPNQLIWYFEMKSWVDRTTRRDKSKNGKFFIIQKSSMTKLPIENFRHLMDNHWKEFEKKIDLKPKLQVPTFKITKKNVPYSVKKIRKKHPRAYEKWTEAEDEFLEKFWKESKKNDDETIGELIQKLGRQRGGIVTRLNKMGYFDILS